MSIDPFVDVAFTGSRKGMTDRQHAVVKQLLERLSPGHVTHGGAIGADASFHDMCLFFAVPIIEVYPSNVESQRARLNPVPQGMESSIALVVHAPQNPLDRNWDIVMNAKTLIACPDSAVETLRSGTWSTVRRAQQIAKIVDILVVKPYDDEAI